MSERPAELRIATRDPRLRFQGGPPKEPQLTKLYLFSKHRTAVLYFCYVRVFTPCLNVSRNLRAAEARGGRASQRGQCGERCRRISFTLIRWARACRERWLLLRRLRLSVLRKASFGTGRPCTRRHLCHFTCTTTRYSGEALPKPCSRWMIRPRVVIIFASMHTRASSGSSDVSSITHGAPGMRHLQGCLSFLSS